jgi:hypothetical protein
MIRQGYFQADTVGGKSVLGVEYENTFPCGIIERPDGTYPVVFVIFTNSPADNDLSGVHSESCDSAIIYGDPDKVGVVSAAAHLFMGLIPTGLTPTPQAIIDDHPELSPEGILEKFGVFFSTLFLGGTYAELEQQGIKGISRNSLDG